MTENIKRTLDLKEEILSFYEITDEDKDIIDYLCFATNTVPVIEAALNICKSEGVNKLGFYMQVLDRFIELGSFPLCCEIIIKKYDSLFDFALQTALPRVAMNVPNALSATPYIDAGIVNVPFDSDDWGKTINISFIRGVEHNYVIEQLLKCLEKTQYELRGDWKLVTGSETRTSEAGFFNFYYGKGWLIREECKRK